MMLQLLKFECGFLLRKPVTIATLLLFFLSGIFMGSLQHLPYPEIFRNSPYYITYFTGICTLGTIFTITILVAQTFLKDTESKIDRLVYALPIRKITYLLPPFLAVLGVTFLALTMAIAGLLIGNYLPGLPLSDRGPFSFSLYVWPLFVLAAPNILLCLSLTACIAWITRSSLSIYMGGLLIFVLYLIGSIYSNSPLMAGASPASPEAMALTAKLDPFGLAAFFEQTRHWSIPERNSSMLALQGNFLINRILWIVISLLVLAVSFQVFSFRKSRTLKHDKKTGIEAPVSGSGHYKPVLASTNSFQHHFNSMLSLVQMDLKVVIGGLPFFLLLMFWTALLVSEITNAVDGGVRMAALFANSSLMVSEIVETLPFMGSLILLFYSNELLWKSKHVGFHALVSASPVSDIGFYCSKFLSLTLLGLGLIVWSTAVGVSLQLFYDYPVIEPSVYGMLFYYTGLPFLLLIILLLFLQHLIANRYAALAVSTFVLLMLNSKLGPMLGLQHPLLRFANTIDQPYFEMNGFGKYATAFHWQMLQELSFGLVLIACTILLWNRNLETGLLLRLRKFKIKAVFRGIICFSLLVSIISGGYITYRTSSEKKTLSGEEFLDWRENYERHYKCFEKMAQPTIVAVNTEVALYPSKGEYWVEGRYKMVNKTGKKLDTLLLYTDPEIQVKALQVENGKLLRSDKVYRHSFYKLNKSLLPQDSLMISFKFQSCWSPFQPHNPTNAILENGSFIRMSRYFPRLGYQPENAIDNVKIRHERKMPPPEPLKSVTAPDRAPYEFIQLNTIVSTEKGQTALGSGELVRTWQKNGRNYYHYITDRPIPFRFAFSSATYKVKKAFYNGTVLEVYYDARHDQNVDRLLKNAIATLAYAEANFGPYPQRTIRFAEISSFATGFAATAYPNIIYSKENQGFHADLRRSNEQDVINQLAGHELAHLWWGSAQVNPDVREGHSVMTETLAQYTELMLYRQMHGQKKSLELVQTHLELYLSGRGYGTEVPLYKADLESPQLVYNKGMVIMHQLELLIGEKQLNKALAQFLRKHAYPNPPPVSFDLLECIYAVSPVTLYPKIDALFKEIVTTDAKMEKAKLKALPNGRYEISFTGHVQTFRTDEKGSKKQIQNDALLDVGIEISDGKLQVYPFSTQHDTLSGKIVVQAKPIKIMLDPMVKHLETTPQDNVLIF